MVRWEMDGVAEPSAINQRWLIPSINTSQPTRRARWQHRREGMSIFIKIYFLKISSNWINFVKYTVFLINVTFGIVLATLELVLWSFRNNTNWYTYTFACFRIHMTFSKVCLLLSWTKIGRWVILRPNCWDFTDFERSWKLSSDSAFELRWLR